MKKTLLFISVVLSLWVSAQDRSIQSQILDQNGDAVPFAAIGILEKKFGAVTFEDGSFTIKEDEKYLEDSLVVFAIGFEQKRISYRRFIEEAPESITVRQIATELDEVIITPKSISFKRIGDKRKLSTSDMSFFEPQQGATMAVPFNEEGSLMQIKEITVGIGKVNLEVFQIRCMIFQFDEDSLPGKQLLGSNLIQNSTDKSGVMTFKLEEDLWVNKPFFVGFEWIVSKAQYEEIQKVKDAHPTEFLDEIKDRFPDLKFSISDNSIVVMRDQKGNSIEEIELTEEQREVMRERKRVNPRVFFRIHYKNEGLKTYSGSYISNSWRSYPFHPIVSIKVGQDKE